MLVRDEHAGEYHTHIRPPCLLLIPYTNPILPLLIKQGLCRR